MLSTSGLGVSRVDGGCGIIAWRDGDLWLAQRYRDSDGMWSRVNGTRRRVSIDDIGLVETQLKGAGTARQRGVELPASNEVFDSVARVLFGGEVIVHGEPGLLVRDMDVEGSLTKFERACLGVVDPRCVFDLVVQGDNVRIVHVFGPNGSVQGSCGWGRAVATGPESSPLHFCKIIRPTRHRGRADGRFVTRLIGSGRRMGCAGGAHSCSRTP